MTSYTNLHIIYNNNVLIVTACAISYLKALYQDNLRSAVQVPLVN